jgi:hypothetical protein
VKETMAWPHAEFQAVQISPPALTSFDLAALGSKNVEELRRANQSPDGSFFEELQLFRDTGSGGNDGKRAI